MQVIGKALIVVGATVLVLGVVLTFYDRIPFLGKLPGDISIKRDNIHVYIPIATSILLSLLVTVILLVVSHFRGK